MSKDIAVFGRHLIRKDWWLGVTLQNGVVRAQSGQFLNSPKACKQRNKESAVASIFSNRFDSALRKN